MSCFSKISIFKFKTRSISFLTHLCRNSQYSFTAKASWNDQTNYTASVNVCWNSIFYQISPKMIDEVSDEKFKISLNNLMAKLGKKNLKDDKELKGYSLISFSIDDEFFQTIKVQLRALGLITKSTKSRSVKDTSTYWTLTLYGDSVMNKLRAIKKDS